MKGGRKMDKRGIKMWFGKQLKNYVKLAQIHGLDAAVIEKLKVAIKDTIFQRLGPIMEPESEQSILKTMTHGDVWVNNMLFSSADPEDSNLTVTLLDFQLLCLSHPAKDIWYLLYINVDKEFRDAHLQTVLKEYHQELSKYLLQEKVSITYEEFFIEISPLRAPMALLFAQMVLFVALCPEPLGFGTFSEMKQFGETCKNLLTSEPKDTDDPIVVEIRRRILGNITELYNENLL